jgi:hypothetical protein
MFVEMDKLLRILTGDGVGLDLPDGSKPFMSSVAVMRAAKRFAKEHDGREPTADELHTLAEALTHRPAIHTNAGSSEEEEIVPLQMATGV